jgi:hypothetical protein
MRRFRLAVLVVVFARLPLVAAGLPAEDRVSNMASVPAAIEAGERFLTNLFDASLDLLPEYKGAKVYWLFHDNYLAAKILGQRHPAVAKRIQASMQRFGVTHSGKIEIVFDPPPNALPFRNYQLVTVTNLAGKQIRTERVTDKVLSGWKEYADLLLLAAIAQSGTNAAAGRQCFKEAMTMWDGHGFNDRASQTQHLYATYKLALALLASERLDRFPPEIPKVLEQLRKLQQPSRGWVTDYNRDGQPRGMANVETTCLALLALKRSSRVFD